MNVTLTTELVYMRIEDEDSIRLEINEPGGTQRFLWQGTLSQLVRLMYRATEIGEDGDR